MSKFNSAVKLLVLFVLIFVVSCVTRYNILYGSFVLDDFTLVINNMFIANVNSLLAVLNPINFFNVLPIRCGARPFTIATLIIDFYFNNLNPLGYHLVNLVLHSLNSCLVFLFCYFLKKDNLLFPISAALLFALHPIQTEVVSVISFRADLLLTFFSLIVLNLLNVLKYDNLKINRTIICSLILIFMAFSFFSKENTIVLPLIVFIYIFFFLNQNKLLKFSLYSFIFISFLFFFFWIERFPVPLYYSIYPNLPQNIVPLSSFVNYVYTIVISLFYNVMHIVYPINLSVDYTLVFSKYIFVGTMIFLILIMLSLKFIKDKYIKFSILSIFVMYLPVSNIIPLVNTVADRYMYYPMIAISILFGLLVIKLKISKKTLIVLLVLLSLTNIFISYTRSKVYNNQYALYSDAINKNPNNIRVVYNMAMAYFDNKQYQKAIDTMDKLISINPMYMRDKVWYIKGLSYEKLDNKEEAIKFYHKAFLLNLNDKGISDSYVLSFTTPKDSINYFITHTKRINLNNISILKKYQNIDDKK